MVRLDWDESVDKDNGYGPYRQSERQHIYQPLIDQLLAEDKAYKCYMTEEELEAEREAQIARGEMPRYGGQHAHLTEEQRQQFEAEGRQPSIRFRVPQNQTYSFDDMVKGIFHLIQMVLVTGLSLKRWYSNVQFCSSYR